MTGTLQIGLRAGEKIYINGAVLRVDRKVRLELLNDATFLLGTHVMQLPEATTPLRQIYFLVQGLLMEPNARSRLLVPIESAIQSVLQAGPDDGVRSCLETAARHIHQGASFDALKLIRVALAHEEGCSTPSEPSTAPMEKEVA